MADAKKEERLKSALRDNLKKRKKALRDRHVKNDANIEAKQENDPSEASESE